MRMCPMTLSPLVRFAAALALLAFMVAHTLCFVHCHLGNGAGNKARPSCHGAQSTTTSHKGSAPSVPPASTTCSTFKTMLVGDAAVSLLSPKFDLLYLIASISLALDAITAQADISSFCDLKTLDWVFPSEMCLGSAHRSLAPPSLS